MALAYNVRYEEREEYLYAHISGPESVHNAISFFRELREKGDAEGYGSFLVVDEVSGKLDTNDTFHISKEIAKLHIGNTIAFVDPKEETFAANAFGGTVVANRGVITRVFDNESDAVEWLTETIKRG